MRNLKSIIVLVVVVAIAAGGFVYLLTRDSGGKTDIIVNVEDIKRIAQLATVEYHISTHLFREKGKAFYEWLSAKFFVFVKGKIKGSAVARPVEAQFPRPGPVGRQENLD